MINITSLFPAINEIHDLTYDQLSTATDVVNGIKFAMLQEYVHTGNRRIGDAAFDLWKLQKDLEGMLDERMSEMESSHDIDC